MMKKLGIFALLFVCFGINIFADESTIADYNTYQTRLTNQDIAKAFSNNLINYLSNNSYYLCQYEIYQNSSQQNYAWRFRIIRNSYNWGTVYALRMDVSNGYFIVKLANTSFSSNEIDAKWIATFRSGSTGRYNIIMSIAREFTAFGDESIMVLRMHNDDYGQASREALSSVLLKLASYFY
jgi:hypothetical protein